MPIVVDDQLPATTLGLESELPTTRPKTHPVEEALGVLQTWNIAPAAGHNELSVPLGDLCAVVPLLVGAAQDYALGAVG